MHWLQVEEKNAKNATRSEWNGIVEEVYADYVQHCTAAN